MAPFLIHPYQPPDKRLYYVIGRCDALQAPAIFLDWDDCSFYVDQNENDCQVEVQSFDRIMDAINYLTDQLTKRAKTKLSPRNIPAAATTAGNQPPHVSAVGNSNSNSNSRAARMPLPEHASLHYSSKRAAENNTSLASSLSAKRPRAEPPAVLVSTTPLNAIMFAKKIAMLQEYQQIHGTVQVKPRHCQEKFKGLSDFMSYWKKKKKHLEEDPSRDKKSALTEARIQQLQDLGVDLDSKWDGQFEKLIEYKEQNGRLSLSKGHPLRDWNLSQRNQMRKYEKDPKTSNLKEEQYQRLVDLGMKAAAGGTETPTTGGTAAAPAPATPEPVTSAQITTASSGEEMLENTS